jgi:hypothetical protein
LPALWAGGRLGAAHKKELLRSLIRRVILSRTAPDTVEAKVVWISGAYSQLVVHPPLHRGRDLPDYDQLVERALALSDEGYQDGEIARRLTAEGFRSARHPYVPAPLVEKIRRQHGRVSLTEQFRRQEKIGGRWTVGGLARELNVTGDWLRRRIAMGALPAERHALTGRYLIVDNPDLLDHLRTLAGARYPRMEAFSCHR